MAIRESVKMLPNEVWKDLPEHETKGAVKHKYAISNQGRLVRYNKRISDGYLLRLSRQANYPIWRKKLNGEFYTALIHRLVAKHFLRRPKASQKFIIHLDHNYENNKASNLRWASQDEVTAHNLKNPRIKAALKRRKENPAKKGPKLDIRKVKGIKKLLKEKKTLREIARKYNVSDMQIYRIKTKENWAHVKI
ncbi:MAG: NUMOD4 domain-containing protein [Chitinophagaceae bacterium]|nr:NUMOD4 domain-containing protein [Chitinophagaceae bacterium]